MKKIEAIIHAAALDNVRNGLVAIGIDRPIVSEVKALDPQSHSGWYRGSEYVTWFAPQIKLELVVGDDALDACVETIRTCGGLGGDAGHAIVVIDVHPGRDGGRARNARSQKVPPYGPRLLSRVPR